MKIQLVGCGNMGRVVLGQLLIVENKKNIWVETHTLKSREAIGREFGVNLGINSNAEIIILLTKPQQFGNIDFSSFLKPKVYISFMAGVSLHKIEKVTESSSVIRVMPNLALSVGKGVVGYYYKNVEKKYLNFFINSFSDSAEMLYCKNEDLIDKITVLSGSGLAYFYYLAELLEAQAQLMGFSKEESKKIAEKTFIGSAFLQKQSGESSREIRKKISSKGGTTEAVIKSLEDARFREVIGNAISVGYQKAVILSK